jgi:hydroxypyruvate isomerase
MVPGDSSYADRFKVVRDAGFQVVQAITEPDERKAEEMKKAAAAAIDSIHGKKTKTAPGKTTTGD